MGGLGEVSQAQCHWVFMNQRREIGVRELGQWELASVLPRICSLVSDLPGHTKSMGRMEDGRREIYGRKAVVKERDIEKED